MLYVLLISDGLADVKTIIKPVGLARVHVELFIRPNDLWDIAGPELFLAYSSPDFFLPEFLLPDCLLRLPCRACVAFKS